MPIVYGPPKNQTSENSNHGKGSDVKPVEKKARRQTVARSNRRASKASS